MSFPNNLPQQLTSFIGRRREMAEVRRLLSSTRLLTLTGAGGCGKTRLALQVASKLTREYRDGVWFVDLAPLMDAALVPQAIASTLGVNEQQGRTLTETLTDYLQSRKMLLVLDNCEHLVEVCASLVDIILNACPDLRILTTSRQSLGVVGETMWRVPSLSLPDPEQRLPIKSLRQYDAVQLFTRRVALKRESFSVTPDNAPVVAQLCHQLDGIPLAIELAAARMNVLAVEEIATKLDNRFRLLTSHDQTSIERHQTLKATLDWSYDLLSDAEQSLLRSLSVFAGGFTLDAVRAVWGMEVDEFETLDMLSQLAEKSLILMEARDGKARYRLLETIRQYAWGRLRTTREWHEMLNRHTLWYLDFAEQAGPELLGPGQVIWTERIETEHDNLRAALRSSKENEDVVTSLRLAGAIWRFWYFRGYFREGREHIAQAIAMAESNVYAQPSEFKAALATALNGAAYLAWMQTEYDVAHSLAQKCLILSREIGEKRNIALALSTLGSTIPDMSIQIHYYEQSLEVYREIGEKRGVAAMLNSLGNMELAQGNLETARAIFEESLLMKRESGDRRSVANLLVSYAQAVGEDKLAWPLYEEALDIFREVVDKRGIATTLNLMGEVAHRWGHYTNARTLYEEGLDIRRKIEERWGEAWSTNNLGRLALDEGDYVTAYSLCTASLNMRRELRDTPGITASLESFAKLSATQDQIERAALLWGAAETLHETLGRPLIPPILTEYERDVAAARSRLDKVAFDNAWEEGRAMTLEEAIKSALEPEPQMMPFQPTKPTKRVLPNGSYPNELTSREVELLRLIASGMTNKQIAAHLSLSVHTVESHLHSAYGKLGVPNRSAAIQFMSNYQF